MDPNKSCPLGHTCNDCHWHIFIQGKDPATGQDVNRKDCAIAWIPTLLIENSMRQYQTAAAVDKLQTTIESDRQELKRIMVSQATKALASDRDCDCDDDEPEGVVFEYEQK